MKAQIYKSSDYVRLFNGSHNDQWLADIRLISNDEQAFDLALTSMRLRRTSKWQPREWGCEASVRRA
jgi:hypothetical protein